MGLCTTPGGMADNVSNDVPRRIDFQTVPDEPFEKDGELFMKFHFIPSPNRYERRTNLEASKESCYKKIIIQSTEVWHQQTRKQKKE